MSDQEWRQAADGQWYPVNHPYPKKSQVKPSTWRLFAVLGLVGACLVVAAGIVAVNSDGEPRPMSADGQAERAMDVVWVGMSSSERVRFCAEARAAGYHVVAREIANGQEPREVEWWLEDRCG